MPLLQLERLTFRFVEVGFAVLSATLLLGVLHDPHWRWDHKTVFSLLGWAVFAACWPGAAAWLARSAGHALAVCRRGPAAAGLRGSRFVFEVLLARPGLTTGTPTMKYLLLLLVVGIGLFLMFGRSRRRPSHRRLTPATARTPGNRGTGADAGLRTAVCTCRATTRCSTPVAARTAATRIAWPARAEAARPRERPATGDRTGGEGNAAA
jgi:hypothetical protein